jgi:hypothetical protein
MRPEKDGRAQGWQVWTAGATKVIPERWGHLRGRKPFAAEGGLRAVGSDGSSPAL